MPALVERGDQPVGEVQRRGRRGDRPLLAREHRLIIGAVGLVGGALAGDIGRQRHAAGALEQQLDRLVAVEMEQDRAVVGLFDDRGGDAFVEVDPVAGLHPPGVADEGPPAAQAFALVQRGADAGVSRACPPAGRG